MFQYYCPTCHIEHIENTPVTFCQHCGDGSISLVFISDQTEKMSYQSKLILAEERLLQKMEAAFVVMETAQAKYWETNQPEDHDACLLATVAYNESVTNLKRIQREMAHAATIETMIDNMLGAA